MCNNGWGRTFTTGLTIIGLHFYQRYQNGVAHFQDFGSQKIQVCRALNNVNFNKCVSSSQVVQVKRLYKVDA